MLYLIEEANAHYRNGNLGLALKKYVAVQKVRSLLSLPLFTETDRGIDI
jgi:hypothetical protein